MVHPSLQPEKIEPKWHRNMPAPKTAVKALRLDQDLSHVTLSANPASRRASEILTDTSLTQLNNLDSLRIDEDAKCMCSKAKPCKEAFESLSK